MIKMASVFSLCVFLLAGVGATQSQPAECSTQWPVKQWPTADAARVGIRAAELASLDADLKAGRFGHVDSMLVIRCGSVVKQAIYSRDYQKTYGELAKKKGPLTPTLNGPYNYYDPAWHPFYRNSSLHTLQSISKTVTSVVIGIAIQRGEFPGIDTPVLKFFDLAQVKNVDDRKQRMTIRHLLTMTAGLEWHESLPYDDPRNSCIIMESLHDWIPFAIDQAMSDEPGRKFNYNSGATQLLSYIFKKATGSDIQDYAARHLFNPLGIKRYFWKRTPTGLTDTEGGLYLRPEDLARIAYLFLRRGQWDGKQIVSHEWVKQSTTPAIEVSADTKYGFKWWLPAYGGNRSTAWVGNGFGGQQVIVFPAEEVIVVFTSWNMPQAPAGATDLTGQVALRLAERLIEERPQAGRD